MITNRRERLLLVGTALVLGTLLLDQAWLTPLLERQRAVETAHRAALNRLRVAQNTQALLPGARALLDEVERDLSRGAKSTAAQDLNARLARLAKDAGARTNKVDFERRQAVDAYTEVVYRLDLQTDIAALQKLLYLLDTSALPLKITNLNINRESKGDGLKVTLRVSMLTLDGRGEDSQ